MATDTQTPQDSQEQSDALLGSLPAEDEKDRIAARRLFRKIGNWGIANVLKHNQGLVAVAAIKQLGDKEGENVDPKDIAKLMEVIPFGSEVSITTINQGLANDAQAQDQQGGIPTPTAPAPEPSPAPMQYATQQPESKTSPAGQDDTQAEPSPKSLMGKALPWVLAGATGLSGLGLGAHLAADKEPAEKPPVPVKRSFIGELEWEVPGIEEENVTSTRESRTGGIGTSRTDDSDRTGSQP